jgi:sulfite exporter TauE/SafE
MNLIVALAGLAAGLVHVLTGPDHLAAITPLAASRPRRAARSGLAWGMGHTGGVVVIALLSLLLRDFLPIGRLSAWSERLVGVVLIAIGLWGLRFALSSRLHAHVHEHDGERHAHLHAHRTPHDHEPAREHRHSHAAFGVGILHGLAGGSHLLGVLPALALPTLGQALVYVGAFGAGSIAAMGAYGACIGAFALRSRAHPLRVYRTLLVTAAGAALGVGCFWLAAA